MQFNMRKLLFLGVLCVLAICNGYSQNYLGKSKEVVKREIIKSYGDDIVVFQEKGYTCYWYTDANDRDYSRSAYFNKSGICIVEQWSTFDHGLGSRWYAFIQSDSKYYPYPSYNMNELMFEDGKITAKYMIKGTALWKSYEVYFFRETERTDVKEFFDLYSKKQIFR